MARFKFVAFAVIVLALGLAHLQLLSPRMAEQATEEASYRAASAALAVGLKLDQRRIELQQSLLRLSASAEVVAALKAGGKVDPERFAPVRKAALPLLPENARGAAIVGLASQGNGVWARGEEAPAPAQNELDLASLSKAGAEGVSQPAFGAPYIFYSVPLHGADRGEAKPLGALVVGLPLLPEGLAEAVASEGKLSAVGLIADGQLVSKGGAEKGLLELSRKELRLGQSAVLVRGQAAAFGPLRLPLLSAGDPLGGKAPLFLGVRQELRGTPYELLSVASTKSFMQALGDYQRRALLGWLALVGLTLLWTLLLSSEKASPEKAGEELRPPPPRPAPTSPERAREPTTLPSAELPPVPETSPEDFQFGPPSPSPAPEAPASEVPPPPEPPLPFEPEEMRTVAYRSSPENPGLNLGFPAPANGAMEPEEDYHEATRVASVPEELIRASAQAGGDVAELLRSAAAPLPSLGPVPFPADPDEPHFQQVFRDFLSTRESCGEAGDGLTFEKFAAKLRKNRDQLVQKYACRTVRFAVYVKDGKAALKATPVKD